MSVKLGEINKNTRCVDNLCWQRDMCARFVSTLPARGASQVAGSLRARWQDESSACLHYIEKGAVS